MGGDEYNWRSIDRQYAYPLDNDRQSLLRRGLCRATRLEFLKTRVVLPFPDMFLSSQQGFYLAGMHCRECGFS
jgi:hypothetical protein